MKHLFIMLLFLVGASSAQQLAPANHENVGAFTREDLGLHGPVKTLKECADSEDPQDCRTYEFNSWGVEVSTLQHRKLTLSFDNFLVFEGQQAGCSTEERYINGKHTVVRYTCPRKGQSDITMDNQFVYDQGRLILKAQAVGGRIEMIQQYIYQQDKSYRMDLYMDGRLGTQEFYDARGFLVREVTHVLDGTLREGEMTYETDAHGNWVKRFYDGELSLIRTITYF